MKEVAQNHLGEEVNRAVITVPAYYNERQRAAVRHAGRAGRASTWSGSSTSPPRRRWPTPSAGSVTQRVLVYDLGGGTFDASVLELQDNVYEVISTGGDTFLGGVDFDNRIVERLLQDWRERRSGAPSTATAWPSPASSTRPSAPSAPSPSAHEFAIQLPYPRHDGRQAGGARGAGSPATRSSALVEPLVDRTIEVCREVLEAKGLTPKRHRRGAPGRRPVAHAAGPRARWQAFFGEAPAQGRPPRRGGGGRRGAARPLARERRGRGAHRRAAHVRSASAFPAGG